MVEDNSVLKLCSLLFSYPEESLQHNKEIDSFIQSLQDKRIKRQLSKFMRYVNSLSYKELSEKYVKEFDFSDQTTLYLTYGVFGDKRERGLGFVKLKMEFAKAGFYLKEEELPDYLPLILEFASMAEPAFVKKVYFIHKKGLDQLDENLKKKKSPYQSLLHVCIHTLEKIIEQDRSIPSGHVQSKNVKEGTV